MKSWVMLNCDVMETCIKMGCFPPDGMNRQDVPGWAVDRIVSAAVERAHEIATSATPDDRLDSYVRLIASSDLYLHCGPDIVAKMTPMYLTTTKNIHDGLCHLPVDCRWTGSKHKEHGSLLGDFSLALVANRGWDHKETMQHWPEFFSTQYRGICELGCAGRYKVIQVSEL